VPRGALRADVFPKKDGQVTVSPCKRTPTPEFQEIKANMKHPSFHHHPEFDNESFLLQRVQPGLSGLMDGSLSTLAPIFAVVLATTSGR
jgi:hypothetical protein